MKNNCKEDREEMIQEIRKAIEMGNLKSNTDLYNLRINLIELGYDFTAKYMDEEEKDFMELIKLA